LESKYFVQVLTVLSILVTIIGNDKEIEDVNHGIHEDGWY